MMVEPGKALRSSLFLFLIPVGVWAAGPERVEKTFDTTPNPRITLSNVTGRVVVKGWEKSQVHALCTTSSPRVEVDSEQVPPKGQAEKIHLSTHVLDPQVRGKDQTSDYTLEVPVESSLEIRNGEGSVRIEKLQGDIRVESVDSPVSVADVAGHLAVHSVGGDIEIIRPSGRVEASSVTGNLHLAGPSSSELDGNTTSGKIIYEGDFVSGSDYHLRTYSGDLDIRCPASVSLELDARSIHGHLDNRIKLTPARRHRGLSPPGNTLLGTTNSGKATLELRSFSGNIRIYPEQ